MSKPTPNHFIRSIAKNDLANGKHEYIYTRFPPEPNGYLHLGHAKSICLNFGLAQDLGGKCNLRFDDTNPEKENVEFVESIRDTVEWLGFEWSKLCYASDYYDHLYNYALELIDKGLAYVDELNPEQMREYRGALTEPGKDSPFRDRSIADNRDLFERMRAGEFAEGEYTLRAKIDMSAPNIVMRDPILYRIRYAHHYRAGDRWCIYPMYDFTHCISDALEGITHSLCTLEFQDNRELYDWILSNITLEENLVGERGKLMPKQIEFGRSNLEYTMASKRKLIQLVNEGHVDGWDDPRLTTLVGLRRRGYTPESIRDFCAEIGVTKRDSTIDMAVLENAIRHNLEASAKRVFGVLDPLKLIITNYPEDQTEFFTVKNHPKDDSMGTRDLPFGREIYIERDDFMLEPPAKFFRLGPGREVRLRYGYAVTCNDVIYDADGNVSELHCSYDPLTAKGQTPDGRKIKGIIHWVSAAQAVDAEVRVYDRLFTEPNPAGADDFIALLNPESLRVYPHAKLEPSVLNADTQDRFQFERVGYFCFDSEDHRADNVVMNRTVSLRDTWAKMGANKK
ncbi:glutamine--tRNA ligase/YqeY domain fusion protein [Arenicella xantha]|uniref:Glutamine--tRNA ligase n=1 Tax=Arenicella xantha TaxID=644221 RepID=A0A395JNH8_9GAMM|nr:glutamine--tRNA ligase/YqeY domain fusion protein [Arenicella xantha]RBP53139.1 glutaminyl-tRNA synthetase [Arenicella xantha]